jgi:hypothetical protein
MVEKEADRDMLVLAARFNYYKILLHKNEIDSPVLKDNDDAVCRVTSTKPKS